MRRVLILLTGAVLMFQSFSISAQDQKKESLVLDGIYVREAVPQRIPVPYPHLREADMMYTKRIWRIIDLREKINHPLYYPTTRMQDRISLVQRLVDAVKYNEISAYDPTPDDEFTTLLSYNQVLQNLDALDKSKTQQSLTTGLDTTVTVKGDIRWKEIKELLVKEEWFFDKQYSTMQVRIIGICPIRHFYRQLQTGSEEEVNGELVRQPIFWIDFREARKVLANTAIFNNFNDAQRITFDDLFFKRRFNSYITAESNVYDNRQIRDYTYGGVPNMQESDRIKNDLFSLEHDLWEY
ncbi:MAG: gliding motility protein GldN [Bacteroidales bacterium]|nr:MAG: gliding motility protein GldN [Bacteroidales bacterium]